MWCEVSVGSSCRRAGIGLHRDASGLFERYFSAPEFEVMHPRQSTLGEIDPVTEAVYGRKTASRAASSMAGRWNCCVKRARISIAQGAECHRAGHDGDRARRGARSVRFRVPLVDSNLVYAQYAVAGQYEIA